MTRRRLILHLVTLTTVILLIIIASGIALHVYARERLRKLNSSRPEEDGHHRDPLVLWNRASNSGQLEVEERVIVENVPYSSTTSTTATSTKRFNYHRPNVTFPSSSPRSGAKLSYVQAEVFDESPRAHLSEVRSPRVSHENLGEVPTSATPSTNPLPNISHRIYKSHRPSSSWHRANEARADPVGEVRSAPVFIQSRPVYSKPSPKPKLLLKPPQQLLKDIPQANPAPSTPELPDVERITQTVYGFLDFVTTIGNTVMVFTPQTKKVEAVTVRPTATAAGNAVQVKPTSQPELSSSDSKEDENSVPNVRQSNLSVNNGRQPKLISFNEDPAPVVIEASEVEPQLYGGASVFQVAPPLEAVNLIPEVPNRKAIVAQPVTPSQPEPQIRTQVNVVASSPNLESGEFIEGEFPPEDSSPPVEVTTPKATYVPSKPKGFTLKLTPKHMSPVIVTPAYSTPVVVTAQKVNLPPPPPQPQQDEPTGVLNQIYETRVKDGKTTVVETKIIGTYIGTQYARVLESTSSVLPKIEATKSASHVFPSASVILAQKAPTTTTTSAPPSTSTSTEAPNGDEDDFEDERANEDEENDQGGGEGQEAEKKQPPSPASPSAIEPTPTASEEQTHYILPQKDTKPEKIYVSPVPNPNAYSRQPQLYVDINPAKSVDVIVTATPTRGKQFRLSNSNRFGNRNKNQATPDSNELTHPQEVVAVPDDSSSRGRSRFGRNRGRSASSGRQNEDVVPTVSVYTNVISATPSRRFKSGRSTTTSSARGKELSFKTAQAGRGFNPSARQQVQVSPTTSTSIYRFKLNRPTGRWRFKPSPKPKVNIIKTKDDEELDNGEGKSDREVQAQAPTNGPVYPQQYEGELQHPEETRTESNELVQEIEPELVPQTLRVATITPTEFSDLDKYLEIATIKSPYVFQAGNVKNTRYITVTKTFTKEVIQPTLASSVSEATLENILATRAPYEKILEGSSDVATLPVIALGGDMATPPLETITQSFSTTQLMLKTSILPVLYEGVTTLYTLTQSYFITRLVTAHKTVPPVELFQFVPTKSLTEFNTALQEAGSEHREHLFGSESEDDNDTNYEHIIAPPDELTSVGSDFDPSSMDEKIPKRPKSSKEQLPRGKSVDTSSPNPFAQPSLVNSIQDPLAGIAGLTPEQLAFIRYFTAQNQQQPHQIPQSPAILPQTQLLPSNSFPQFPQLQGAVQPQAVGQQFSVTSSPVVVDTTATVTETKTLRLLFGAKPTYTVLYSTRVVPTRMTTYVTASVPVKPTAAIQNPFLNALPFPLAYVG